MRTRPVVVLGAGLAGVCTALALAQRGRRVTIVDQEADCLLRASLRAEGKIHLGLVYAHDPTLRSLDRMLEGAIHFDRIVERLIGRPVDWEQLRSTPFLYAVLEGSLRSPTELAATYQTLQDRYERLGAEDSYTYVGTRPRRLASTLPVEEARRWLAAERIQTVFATEELALDLARFRVVLKQSLERAPNVERLFGHRVEHAVRTAGGFRLDGRTAAGDSWSLDAGVVVNCLWENRLGVDAQLGLTPARPWVHRLKFRLLGRLPDELSGLPSFTFVLGPFGDIVTWPWGRVYLSWYPACLRGWCSELLVPEAWDAPCRGDVDPQVAEEIAAAALQELERIVPGVSAVTIDTVDAGVITAWGATDVDDPASELHERHEVGPRAHDGWITVDTGKLTTAPLFGDLAAELAIEAGA